MRFVSIAFIVLSVAVTAATVAAQSPRCAELGGNIVYGVGASSHTPFIGQLASRLRETEDPAHQLTIVYAEPGSCYALDLDAPLTDSPTGTTARYWSAANATAKTCVLEDAVVPGFSIEQNPPGSCEAQLSDGAGTFVGPVSTFNVIVPAGSTQKSISAEALYFLLAFGDAAQADPWNDERYFVHNGPASLVVRWIAAAVGAPGEIQHGYQPQGGAGVLQLVTQAGARGSNEPDAERTLGLVSGENAENGRAQARTLAYQHFEQACGYYPDSAPDAFDKLNVRTGRYALWSPIYFHARVDDEGAIEDEHLARFVGYATGTLEPPAELPVLDIVIDGYNVPQCAMQVQRDAEGVLSSYQPDAPCGCYFEARATGGSSCAECSEDSDCASDAACHHGYCEP